MCEFISWIEYKDEILYVTSEDLESSRGKKLLKKTQCYSDRLGHGFIRAYYNIAGDKGLDKEYSDFSTPDNFPKQIVRDIKKGLFRGFDTPKKLLNKPAWAEYEKVKRTAWAEYEKVEQTALADQKVERTALAEYEKVEQTAFWGLFAKKKNRSLAWR